MPQLKFVRWQMPGTVEAIKHQAQFLYKVYSKTTRDAVLSQYKDPAEKLVKEMAVTLNMVLNRLKGNMEDQNVQELETNRKYYDRSCFEKSTAGEI